MTGKMDYIMVLKINQSEINDRMESSFWTILPQAVALTVLIGISAFCSSAEMALFSLSRPKLLACKESDKPVRRLIWKLMDRQASTLITIIFCNMFVNSLVSMVNESLLAALDLPPSLTLAASAFSGIVILLLLGEITPMTIAYVYSEKWAEVVARPVHWACIILKPLTSLVEWLCNVLMDLLGRVREEGLKPEEYLSYIENGVKRGSFTSEEAKLMKETIALRRKTVESVMRTRSNLYYVTRKDSPETVRKIIREHAQAYLPVSCEKRLDSADAILSARLFFSLPPEARNNWRNSSCVLENALFIPEATTLEKALRTLKDKRAYAALAADEYGAVSGIITREDIYSELAGKSIELDEQSESELLKVGRDQWLFDGAATLDFMNMALSLPPRRGRFAASTLNGVFCELLGAIPQQDDRVSFDNVTLQAHTVTGNRVSRVLVTVDPDAPAGDDDAEGGAGK